MSTVCMYVDMMTLKRSKKEGGDLHTLRVKGSTFGNWLEVLFHGVSLRFLADLYTKNQRLKDMTNRHDIVECSYILQEKSSYRGGISSLQ